MKRQRTLRLVPTEKYHPRFNYLYLQLLELTGKLNGAWHRLGPRIKVEPYPEGYMMFALNPKSVLWGNCARLFSSQVRGSLFRSH